MNIIPAIDLLDGNVVRLLKGQYENVTVYDESPLNTARAFKDAGFHHIHIVDLNGAKEGKFVNLPYIQEIISDLELSVQTGGGIRSYSDVESLIEAGLSKVICSSMAIKNEKDWLQALTDFPEHMILGMDLKDGKIAYSGWLETAEEDTFSFLERMIDSGLKEVLCTDISKDGTLSGPNIDLYKSVKSEFPELKLIASGGVSNVNDLIALDDAKIEACVVGRAYYENHISLEEMQSVND